MILDVSRDVYRNLYDAGTILVSLEYNAVH